LPIVGPLATIDAELLRSTKLALVGLASVVGLCLAACGAVAGTPASRPEEQVVLTTFTRTVAAKTAQVSFEETISAASGASTQTVVIKGSGVTEFDGMREEMTLSVPNIGTIEERVIGTALYVQVPKAERSALTLGSAWAQLDVNQFMQSELGVSLPQVTNPYEAPGQVLEELSGLSAGSVVDLGPAVVRGTPTTEYQADVEFTKLVGRDTAFSQVAQVLRADTDATDQPVDIWLDSAGLVRRIDMDMNFVALSASSDYTCDLWGFGNPVKIEAPPPGQIAILGTFPPASTTP